MASSPDGEGTDPMDPFHGPRRRPQAPKAQGFAHSHAYVTS